MKFIYCLLISLFSVTAMAQFYYPDESINGEPWLSWKRVYTGGQLGLSFGQLTFINISPDFGYRITDRFSAGLGPIYISYKDNRPPVYSIKMYGGKVFARMDLFKFLFAHTEYQMLNVPSFNFVDQRLWLNNVWAGGGLSQGSGPMRFFIMALWNLGPDDSIFRSPQITGGVGIGL